MTKSKFTTPEDVKEAIDGATKRIDLLLTGVLIVMFVGFVTLLIGVISPMIDAWRFRATSYEMLRDSIQAQNTKLDTQGEQIKTLTSKISDLQWMISQQNKAQ